MHLGDTSDHVLNVRADSADTRNFLEITFLNISKNLALGKPRIHTNLLLSNHRHLQVKVLEVTLKDTTGALDADRATLHLNLN